jgi:hypothetical protein
MVFLAMMTVLTASALGVAGLEARMAGNSSSRLLAFELADSVFVEVSENPESFALSGEPGAIPCRGDSSEYNCEASLPVLDAHARYTVTRLSPGWSAVFELRDPESQASGVDHFDTAHFEIAVTVGDATGRLGRLHVVQGVAIRVPAVND